MIREISVHPKPTNNKAKISFYTFLTLFVFGTAVYFVMRTLEVEKSGLIGFIPLVSVTVAIFFYNKYLGSKYYYDVVIDSEGTPLFVIRQIVGKRASTLCRIALSDIVKVERETAEERKAHKTPTDYRKYIYVPTFKPETTYRIISRSRYEKSEIVIECSDEFAETIGAYAAEARANAIRMDEEDEY